MMWSLLPVFHLQRGGSDGDALARDVVEHVDLVGEPAAREDLEDVERFLERAARRPLLHHALHVLALEPHGSGGPPDASGRGGGGPRAPGPAAGAEVASVSRVATVVLMIVAMRHVFLALEGPDPSTVGYLSIRKVPPRQGGDGGLGRAHPPARPGAAVWHDGVMRAPRLPVLVALSALAVLTGCSRAVVGTPPVVSTPPEPPALGIEEVGLASW